ncbi:MAG: AAA family ATPase [Coriobacteriia bacterium]|nr:AAA family ATPase [Coriobacteriia bacterium]
MKNAKVLAVVNQKGGVGKSTTAVNLSAALGEAGKRVLLIDMDPQGNATSGLGLSKDNRELCIYDALVAGEANFEDIIETHGTYPVDVVPATIQLAGAEVELVQAMSRETRLKSLIEPERGKYDYIIIDCAPSLGLLTINALTAADGVFIPIQCEFYSLEGLSKLLDSVRLVNKHLNPDLEVFGVVMTMYDGRTKLAQQVVDEVRDYFGDKAFQTLIPRSVRISEAPSFGQSVLEYDDKGKGATAYRNLAKEVMNRG